MARLEGKDDMDKLKQLSGKPYKDQAHWFLNYSWKKLFDKDVAARLKVWDYAHLMIELDKRGVKGNELNEFDAHRFLEKFEEPMTVKDMREMLRNIDLDFNKMVSLTEYFVCKYKLDWHGLVNAVMGENTAEMDKAKAMVEEAERSLSVAIRRAEEADKAEREQVAAENELRRALKQLEEEETSYNNACSALAKIRDDEGKSTVQRSKASNEFQQLKAKDPLPLQRAKINQAAAVRKAERATAAAAEARAQAEKSLQEAQQAFDDAQKYLDEVSKMVGSAEGTMWWMSHELEEAKKYLPQSKGGKSKK